MKGKTFWKSGLLGACLLLLVLADTAGAQSFVPVSAPLVRQGTFAVSLASSLGINIGLSETAAINNLTAIGIIPRGGWVPSALVTPAFIGELWHSVFLAARSGQVPVGGFRALVQFNNVRVRLGLPIFPVAAASRAAFLNANAFDPRLTSRFFAINGVPPLTFFAPPAQFRAFFNFTPFPFVFSNVFFPGFFTLNDRFARISNFGFNTPALTAFDNARHFRSVRFSTDALITARLRSPNFSTSFRWPSIFNSPFIAADEVALFGSNVPFPFVSPNVFFPGFFSPRGSGLFIRASNFGLTTPALIALDNALLFGSVRFSTDALITARLRSPNFSTSFRWPSAFTSLDSSNFSTSLRQPSAFVTPRSIAVDNALRFNSVRFSTDGVLVRGFSNVVPRAAFSGVPRPFAKVGARGGKRGAARRR